MRVLILLLLGMMPQTQTPDCSVTVMCTSTVCAAEYEAKCGVDARIRRALADIDVPAIQGEWSDWDDLDNAALDITTQHEMQFRERGNIMQFRVRYWTCADKSRILLTAEDGTRHCVKFK